MDQIFGIMFLACCAYGVYLVYGLIVFLVTAPPGTLTDAMIAAEASPEEDARDRRRRRERREPSED